MWLTLASLAFTMQVEAKGDSLLHNTHRILRHYDARTPSAAQPTSLGVGAHGYGNAAAASFKPVQHQGGAILENGLDHAATNRQPQQSWQQRRQQQATSKPSKPVQQEAADSDVVDLVSSDAEEEDVDHSQQQQQRIRSNGDDTGKEEYWEEGYHQQQQHEEEAGSSREEEEEETSGEAAESLGEAISDLSLSGMCCSSLA